MMESIAHAIAAPFRRAPTWGTLAAVGGLASRSRGADEAALAQRAAAGDGDAFATLYERYESRTYNLCYRILGSRDDAADATQEAFVNVLRRLPKLEGRELAFGSYVFTSARNACYDLIERGRRAEPSDEISEHATPMGGGVGGGGVGFDPGDPEDDPERNVLLEARTEEIRLANLTLPERQREVLALRELEELSYDEIAELMDMNRNSVAQLISRARINLRDALRGSALASIAASSPDCERAVPLIALEQDGQLDDAAPETDWLADHLLDCDSCHLRREAMADAGLSYRSWLPVAAGPLLFRETMAEAAELVGADWSETIARREAKRAVPRHKPKRTVASTASDSAPPVRPRDLVAGGGGAAAAAGAGAEGARAAVFRHRRLDLVLIGVLACLLVLVFLVGATSDDDPVGTVVPAVEEQPAAAAAEAEPEKPAPGKARKKAAKKEEPEPAAVAPVSELDEPTAPPAVEPEPAPTETTPERRRRADRRGRVERRRERGGQDAVTPEVTPEPEPPPPPAPVPTETTPPAPTETAPPPPPQCFDANGRPIPCDQPPPPPPPRCTPPTSPNCQPGGPPPRR
jgi:RNA polymerase sigma factor (sigma-70 family)